MLQMSSYCLFYLLFTTDRMYSVPSRLKLMTTIIIMIIIITFLAHFCGLLFLNIINLHVVRLYSLHVCCIFEHIPINSRMFQDLILIL